MTVSKSAITASAGAASGVNVREARAVIDAFLAEITSSLSSGDSVSLGAFGSFVLVDQGISSASGGLKAPALKVPKFKAGKALRDAIR
jgi:DNA-binding protein HU-beta